MARPDISIGSMLKSHTNGRSCYAICIDGKTVFVLIGYMNVGRGDLPSFNEVRHMLGFKMDARYKDCEAIEQAAHAEFAKQQAVARAMMPMHLNAEAKAYAIQLQDYIECRSHSARSMTSGAIECDATERHYTAHEYRTAALEYQRMAAEGFAKLAGVRGLFDTPAMSDAHAAECEPSRVGGRAFAYIEACKPGYRERAFNCYGRYAMYCARADVAPYAFPDWFADCYMGHEYDVAANWN